MAEYAWFKLPPPPRAADAAAWLEIDRIDIGGRTRFDERAAGCGRNVRDRPQCFGHANRNRLHRVGKDDLAWNAGRLIASFGGRHRIRVGSQVQEYKTPPCVSRDGRGLRRTDGGHLRSRNGSRGVGIKNGSAEATRGRRQCPCFLASECDEQRKRDCDLPTANSFHIITPLEMEFNCMAPQALPRTNTNSRKLNEHPFDNP